MIKTMHRERSVNIVDLVPCTANIFHRRKQNCFIFETPYNKLFNSSSHKFCLLPNPNEPGLLKVKNYFIDLIESGCLALVRMFYFFNIELVRIRLFNICHLMLIIFTTGLQNRLDLGNRNNRHVFRKKEEAGKKQSECTKVKPYLPDRRTVIGTPGRREIIPVGSRYYD